MRPSSQVIRDIDFFPVRAALLSAYYCNRIPKAL